jgi:hypothetical protein
LDGVATAGGLGDDSEIFLEGAGSHTDRGLIAEASDLDDTPGGLSDGSHLQGRRCDTTWRLCDLRHHAAVVLAVICPGSESLEAGRRRRYDRSSAVAYTTDPLV